jgi:hypothetical protein
MPTMTAKAITRATSIPFGAVLLPDPWLTLPLSTEIRLERIRVLGRRIDSHIQLMCQAAALAGASLEAKDKAVAFFYERLVAMEQQLDRIQEAFRLE